MSATSWGPHTARRSAGSSSHFTPENTEAQRHQVTHLRLQTRNGPSWEAPPGLAGGRPDIFKVEAQRFPACGQLALLPSLRGVG